MAWKYKPKNNQTDTETNSSNPMFNSSLTYLDRLNFLFQQAHVASSDDEDVFDWIMALEQAHIEVDPRLDPDKQQFLEDLRKDTHRQFREAKMSNKSFPFMREVVRPYHLAINRFAHEAKLIMRDSQEADMDNFV